MTQPGQQRLVDRFGRVHNNLRISVTDRCNIRCFYCMPAEDVQFLPKQQLLTFEEIERVARVGVTLGIDRLRLTGGEPLVRRDLPMLVRALADIPGIVDIGLTTNGILLPELAQPLRDAGLRRLNISLDALDPEVFRRVTRRDGYEQVLAGIEAARKAGFSPIKLNAVILRGVNEQDILPLVAFAKKRGMWLRFIESMPIGAEPWNRQEMLNGWEIRQIIEQVYGLLVPDPAANPHSPSEDFLFSDGTPGLGFISAVSRPFCQNCDRVRLTADGKLRNCLFSLIEHDLRPILATRKPELLETLIRKVVWEKWEGHEINSSKFLKPNRTMHAIGG